MTICLFQSFFQFFSLRLSEEDNPLLLCACFDKVCLLEQIHILIDVVIVSCIIAGSGFKMAASKFKMAGLCRHCDVTASHNLDVKGPIC